MIKRIALLTRKDGLSREDFLTHWREIHGPLARAVPGIRRYVQATVVEQPVRADIPSPPDMVDGIAELWYDDRAAMEASTATPEAQALYADGALIIGRIQTFVVEEDTVIPAP